MTDQPKNESDQETDTALFPDNVVSVDFGSKKSIGASDVSLQIYMVEETKTIGLHFSHPVDDFKVDLAGADQLINSLVQAFMKLKEGKSS